MDPEAPRARPPGTLAVPPERVTVGRLVDRLRGPLVLVAVAVLMTLGNWAYAHLTGETLGVGSLRLVWLAAPIALVGVGLACWRILGAP
jgi:hypothetical protein